MAPWTLQERMTLHVLFGHHKLNFYGRDWWALRSDITKTWRTERTCRQDYKYSHGKERTKMYPDRILKRYSEYDAEERAAYDKAFQDVIYSARRQGITLPDAVDKEDDEAEANEDEEGEKDKEAVAGEDEGEESEEIEDEEFENKDEENGDEKDEDEQDVEMEDAVEEYATASEGGSNIEDAAGGSATAHNADAVNSFRFPDFPDELAEEEFPSMRNAIVLLSAAIRAHETTSKKPRITAIPAITTHTLSAQEKTVAKPKPRAANSIAVVDSTAKISAPLTSSNGEPQKNSPTRSRKPEVEVKNEIADAAKTPKRRHGRLMDDDGFFNAYVSSGLDNDIESQRKKPRIEPTEKLRNTTANGRVTSSNIIDSPPKTAKKPHNDPKNTTANSQVPSGNIMESPPKTAKTPYNNSKKPLQNQVSVDHESSKKSRTQGQFSQPKPAKLSTRTQDQIETQVQPSTSKASLAPAPATNKPAQRSTRAQNQFEDQVKPATSKANLPPAPVNNKPQAEKSQADKPANKAQGSDALTVRDKKYDEWCRTNLDRILFDEPYNMCPNQIKVPGKRAPPQHPLPSDDRVVNFFSDMFDGQLAKKLLLSTLKKEPESDKPGRRLKKIYKTLIEKAEESSITPAYHLNKVFDSEESPFRNFRLASAAFGQGLKMVHMSDLDYTSVGNQQLVAFAKFKNRHLSFDDVKFIGPEDPVFKRGGRVHKIWVRQQECSILGECKKYNTAHVCIDVMVCQECQCSKCSKDEDFGTQPRLITSLPRVHSRHVSPGDQFEAPVPTMSREFEKDYRGEFIVDLNIGVQSVKLWDGTAQDVVICDRANCPGCVEADGGVVEMSKEERDRAYTKTGRL
ncbi:hypothetical protein Q7P35_006651 [Cladosporium inversicolor]